MKVYVLFTQVTYDYEESNNIKVFSSMEKAKAAFDEFVKAEKKDAEDKEWDSIELSETCFEAYPEGCYDEDHVLANIEEQELR